MASPSPERISLESFDAAPVAIFVTNSEKQFIAVNATACDLVGYTREELLQLTVPQIALGDVNFLYEDLKKTGRQAGIIWIR